MKQKRFSVEQIVGVLKQAEAGVPVAELIRRAGISEQTFYRWKKQYVGLEVDQVHQLKQLQEENGRLKQLVDKTMLQDVLAKSSKALAVPPGGGIPVRGLSGERAAGVQSVANEPWDLYRYRNHKNPQTELRMRIREIAQSRVRYGYRKIRVLLNREGWNVGRYLVCRLYQEEGLTLRQRPQRRRRVAVERRERVKPSAPNQVWSLDFVSDQLTDGRRFRALTVVDIYTRESLAIEAGQNLKGEDVVRALYRIQSQRGVPKRLFCDNGSEFTSQAMDLWAYQNGVRIDFSRPGKPTDNAFVESFNGTFRAECLDAHWFTTLKEAQQLIEAWRREYNESRPHRALGERTPHEFAYQIAASRDLMSLQGAESSL